MRSGETVARAKPTPASMPCSTLRTLTKDNMPSIIGSIPDIQTPPITDYLSLARQSGIRRLDYNELLMCLLMARLGVDT